jgi:hypothetical protein
MKTRFHQLSFSAFAEFLQRTFASLTAVSGGYRLAPIPSAVPLRSPGARHLRSSSGWRAARLVLLWGIFFLTLSSVSVWAGQPTLPSGVPNIFSPEVREHFEFMGVTHLRGNPDFPMVLLMNKEEDTPEVMLLGLDARNGEETWSLESDPIILIVTFTDAKTIQSLYVDAGFAGQGKASGKYAPLDNKSSSALPDLLKAVIETSNRTSI